MVGTEQYMNMPQCLDLSLKYPCAKMVGPAVTQEETRELSIIEQNGKSGTSTRSCENGSPLASQSQVTGGIFYSLAELRPPKCHTHTRQCSLMANNEETGSLSVDSLFAVITGILRSCRTSLNQAMSATLKLHRETEDGISTR